MKPEHKILDRIRTNEIWIKKHRQEGDYYRAWILTIENNSLKWVLKND